MQPKDLEVGRKYIWFGCSQADIMQYEGRDETCFDIYHLKFTSIASTNKWDDANVKIWFNIGVVKAMSPYEAMWQFCDLFFKFYVNRRRCKLESL